MAVRFDILMALVKTDEICSFMVQRSAEESEIPDIDGGSGCVDRIFVFGVFTASI